MRALTLCCCVVLVGCAARPPSEPNSSAFGEAERRAASLLEQGRAFAELGDWLRAQQYFAASLKAGASERLVLPLLLEACVAEKNYRLAVEYAEGALARHPRDARLRFVTGALHGTLGDVVRSRECLERAAVELPRDAEVQFTVAVFFRDHAQDPGAADTYFRRYLALAPDGSHSEEAKNSVMERVE